MFYVIEHMRGNFLYKKLGYEIVSARKKRCLSQEKLSLISDIDRTYLARIEEGKANPSLKILHKISKMLKMKITKLLKGM